METLPDSLDLRLADTPGALPDLGNVALRPVQDADLPFLFRLLSDPERSHLWMRERRIDDEREFQEAWGGWAQGQMGAKLVVEVAARPIGLVFEYDRCLEDGHTKVTALVEEQAVGCGTGLVATALLEDWLFRTLPLRKVYHEVYGYNASVLRLLRKLGFVEEAVLREHRFHDGRYWDKHVLVLHREAYPLVRNRILGKRPRSVTQPPASGNGRDVRPADAAESDAVR